MPIPSMIKKSLMEQKLMAYLLITSNILNNVDYNEFGRNKMRSNEKTIINNNTDSKHEFCTNRFIVGGM